MAGFLLPLFFMEERIYTVSEISQEIKRVVEQFIAPVWVEGEISNYSFSRSGHIYFSLKDQFSLISCIIWKSVAYSIPFQISEGMRVLVYGNVTTYVAQSRYQINILEVKPAGVGTLYMAFEALKKRLSEEGLFDESRKMEIPAYPKKIGVVTSVYGAAIQDILQITKRRNPSIGIVIYPAKVQGKGAAESIVNGIETFNRLANVDFIIIGRGGGSLEDLWAFNEEKVVRAIESSELPIISAVGHEVDFSLSDFAADLRAPTPSAAVEMTVPEAVEIKLALEGFCQRLSDILLSKFKQSKTELNGYSEKLLMNRPLQLLQQRWQRLDELEGRLIVTVQQCMRSYMLRLEAFVKTLKAMDPKAILLRGFSIVYHLPKKVIVKSVTDVKQGELLSIEVSDGIFSASVESAS